MRVAAVVPAAGAGERLGGSTPKQFASLGRVPVLVHTLRALEASSVEAIFVVVPPGQVRWCRQKLVRPYGFLKVRAVLAGGASRGGSVRRGVERVPPKFDFLLIHDGARPLVTPSLIEQVIAAAKEAGAALSAVPEVDTVKAGARGGWVHRTLRRDRLWRAQTPQAFRASLFREALRRASREGYDGTDDSSLAERAGYRVRVVEGDPNNIKITTPMDLALAGLLLKGKKS